MGADVRVLVGEARAEARRRLRRRTLPAVGVLLAVTAGFGVGAVVGDGGLAVVAAWFAALAVVLAGALPLRHPHRAPALEVETVAGTPSSVLRRPPGAFRAGLAILAVSAVLPAALAGLALTEGRPDIALGAAAVAVLLLVPVGAALAGAYVPGDLALGPHGIRYRHLGLESWVAWDDVDVVEVREPATQVDVVAPDGGVRHRYRAGLLRGQRAAPPEWAELHLREWGVLATDVGRLLLHYAAAPADRAELGTPAAAARWQAITTLPVDLRQAAWRVGEDDGLERVPQRRQDAALRVWHDAPGDRAAAAAGGYARRRLTAGLVVLGLAVVVGAVSRVDSPAGVVAALGIAVAVAAGVALVLVAPRRLDVGRAPDEGGVARTDGVVLRRSAVRLWLGAAVPGGLALAAGAALVNNAVSWPAGVTAAVGLLTAGLLAPAVLVALGGYSPGELLLTEQELRYRSGLRSWRAAWGDLVQVDAMWDDVVRVERRDGAVHWLDARGLPVPSDDVVDLLEGYVLAGGPRGDTRSVAAVLRRVEGT